MLKVYEFNNHSCFKYLTIVFNLTILFYLTNIV